MRSGRCRAPNFEMQAELAARPAAVEQSGQWQRTSAAIPALLQIESVSCPLLNMRGLQLPDVCASLASAPAAATLRHLSGNAPRRPVSLLHEPPKHHSFTGSCIRGMRGALPSMACTLQANRACALSCDVLPSRARWPSPPGCPHPAPPAAALHSACPEPLCTGTGCRTSGPAHPPPPGVGQGCSTVRQGGYGQLAAAAYCYLLRSYSNMQLQAGRRVSSHLHPNATSKCSSPAIRARAARRRRQGRPHAAVPLPPAPSPCPAQDKGRQAQQECSSKQRCADITAKAWKPLCC